MVEIIGWMFAGWFILSVISIGLLATYAYFACPFDGDEFNW